MDSFEQKIGYKFHNSLLLAEALTHPSLAYETHRPHFDNQRLEFLGDAVLQLVLTEELFTRFSEFQEGPLTKLRARIVSRPALADRATAIGLGEFLMMGKGEETSGGRKRASALADGFEALVGAIHLDGGIEASSEFILRQCRGVLEEVSIAPEENNPKGQLQEILQSVSPTSPSYHVVSSVGPDHCKTFTIEVAWKDVVLARGEGNSKKNAEIQAALAALESDTVKELEKSQSNVDENESVNSV